MFIGHFPSEFNSGTVDETLLKPADKVTIAYTIAYLAGFIIIAIAGAAFQFKYIEEEEVKDDVMDGEEEGKCCGVF